MLYGDWGTSRLYVLGLAFAFSAYAAPYFILGISALVAAVGWAYTIVCRCIPDGGGVYSIARQRSQALGVLGALLLIADYVVTASLSSLEAFHYLGFHHEAWWAIGAILLLGGLNYFGPRGAGRAAAAVAMAAVGANVVIALAAVPYLGQARFEAPSGTGLEIWVQFTGIILALSGAEAIANMTGLMVRPVENTAKKSILPVMGEIFLLNIILCLAMCAIPGLEGHTEDMLNKLADYYVGPGFARASGIAFSLLLLSATNTALTGLVSVIFLLGRDEEIPEGVTRLNGFGVPWVALAISVAVPVGVLMVESSVVGLAALYAVGVIGAIVLNLGLCSINLELPIKWWERVGLLSLCLFLASAWVTIAISKQAALIFCLMVIGTGFVARALNSMTRERAAAAARAPGGIPSLSAAEADASLSFLEAARLDPDAPRILAAIRGPTQLVDRAVEEAGRRKANLFVVFIREIPGMTVQFFSSKDGLKHDQEAQAVFRAVAEKAAESGVPFTPIYGVANTGSELLLDFAATLGIDCLVLGVSKRGGLWKALKGDFISEVAAELPEGIQLAIFA